MAIAPPSTTDTIDSKLPEDLLRQLGSLVDDDRNAFADQSPDSRILRALTRGLSAGARSSDLRRYLTSHRDPVLRSRAADNHNFSRLLSLARDAARATDPAKLQATIERETLAVARRLVARIVTPGDDGLAPKTDATSRAAYAVIGVQLIRRMREKGELYVSILVTAGWLGARLGIGEAAASRTIRALERRGWITRAGKRGRGVKWKLPKLYTDQLQKSADAHRETIDGLRELRSDTRLAALIIEADHPTWWYSKAGRSTIFGTAAWISQVHAAAELPDDVTIGAAPRARKSMTMKLVDVAAVSGPELRVALDELGAPYEAAKGRAQRDAELVEASRAWKEQREELRRQRNAEAAIKWRVSDVLNNGAYGTKKSGGIGRIPRASKVGEEKWVAAAATWSKQLIGYLTDGDGLGRLEADDRDEFAHFLLNDLIKAARVTGGTAASRDVIERFVGIVIGEVF